MDNFKIIYRILSYFEAAMDLEKANLEEISSERLRITEQRWISIIRMLVDEGYIEGLVIHQSADGFISISISYPRITLKGLEYLKDNSMMKQVYRTLKGIKDVTPGI